MGDIVGVAPKVVSYLWRDTLDYYGRHLTISGDSSACERFSDGQEIIVERHFEIPEGSCPWAWADIRRDIKTIAAGGNLSWVRGHKPSLHRTGNSVPRSLILGQLLDYIRVMETINNGG